MATTLGEMQFELLPYDDAEQGVLFGIGCDISCNSDGFRPSGPSWYTEDSENPVNGATAFGRDHLIGPSWAWALHVNRDQVANALVSAAELGAAWRAPVVRDQVGAVLAVRYQLAGRTRRVFGRPRRFEYSPDNSLLTGFMPVDVDFKCADAYVYDDLETSASLGLVTESVGGIILPAVLPVSLQPSGENDGAIRVSGDADTYPVIRFEGPITNPILETSDWKLSLDMSLDDGEYVEVDTRPWSQTILFNNDTSVAGALGKRQWLSEMKFTPGDHELTFHGSASSPGGRCEVRWRSAWNTI